MLSNGTTYGSEEELYSSGHEVSKTVIGKGTLTIQKLVAIWMWEAPASQSFSHLSKKLNICQSVKRDSEINFEASFVAAYSNYILLLCMKTESD